MNPVAKHYLVGVATLYGLSALLPTIIIRDIISLLLASFVLMINLFVLKPLLKLIFLPITVITLGFFGLIINVFLVWMISYLVPDFVILPMVVFGLALNKFASLIVASIIITTVYTLIDRYLPV